MKKTKPSPRRSTPLDAQIGARVRHFRQLKDITMESLAKAAGVTWQQIQKYEEGHDRISVTRLITISTTLDVPILSLLYEDIKLNPDSNFDKEAQVLLDCYNRLNNKAMKKKLIEIAEAMADNRPV